MAQEIKQDEMEKIAKEAFFTLVNVYKLEGIDYTSLSKPMQAAALQCFIEGVKYVRDTVVKAQEDHRKILESAF